MEASAEDWLQSVTDGMDLAHRLGERVLIIGTSTGAPLGCWAAKVLAERYGSPLAMMLWHRILASTNPSLGYSRSWQSVFHPLDPGCYENVGGRI